MTDHKPMPVKGYTNQSDQNIALVNQNKRIEEAVLRQLDLIANVQGVEARWLAVGRRHIEQGFMEVNRSIFKPNRIQGDI
jgi:hypothetical protein